jgi:transposase
MDFSASAATKDAARIRRRRSCTPPRFSSTPPSLVPLINEQGEKEKAEMNGNSLGVDVGVCPEALAAAERSEGERSEPQRSAAAARAGADSLVASRPDPEVVAKPKRRTYTAEYKQRILEEAAAATRGGVGALLRREGLYSSLLATWRRERANGIREALTPQKRGPKSMRNPMDEEVQKLRRQNARLTEDLRKAHIIIDVQKKVAALLGRPVPEQDPEENS